MPLGLISSGTGGEQRLDILDHHAVVMAGLGIRREHVCMVGSKLGIVGDGCGFSASTNEMMRDSNGHLFLASLVGALEDSGGTQVQAGALDTHDIVVQVADEQGMPEMIGDARARALLGDD